eukprot:CAMPEP_0117426108 /NCGR_PEP_ID=MMETSP0758-20121206/6277_1 /TAXON_ID=63605 /ORGANISM="Percolomonas cosmopolitus, Strain AE-1 (ATCC 50343)" /LENGTH=380 /DNA_ID=CAMNT_0005211057 /DNA_START=450 /DNA_END=1592 /DNA_ORIENTATION=+
MIVFQHTIQIIEKESIDNTLSNYMIRKIEMTERIDNGKLYAYIDRYRIKMPSPFYQITTNNEKDEEDDKDYIVRAVQRSMATQELLEGFSIELNHEAFLNDTIEEGELHTRTMEDIGVELGEIYDTYVEDIIIKKKQCKMVEYASTEKQDGEEDKEPFLFGEIIMDTQSKRPETRILCIRYFARKRRYRRMKKQFMKSLEEFTFTENTMKNDYLWYYHNRLDFGIKIPRYMTIHDNIGGILTFSIGNEETTIHMTEKATETRFDFEYPTEPSIWDEYVTTMTHTLKQNLLHVLTTQHEGNIWVHESKQEILAHFDETQVLTVYYTKGTAKGNMSYYTTFIVTQPGVIYRIRSSQKGDYIHPTYLNMVKRIHAQFKIKPYS